MMGESDTNTVIIPELIDHSRIEDAPVSRLDSASNLILIDNYDSFTWNVYQYLVLEGATVTVFRNDKITLSELKAKNPTQLVISPGPGHPDTDAGISREAIEYFTGKIPIFGVCMGQQCIISHFGGKVDVTGEIRHGKTSPLRHDGKGVYAGMAQDLPVTRYHSLAGTPLTLPPCLEVSSFIAAGADGGKEVIMGVRHKEYVIEGVQFHPESILTEDGRKMFRNFLKMTGGRWEDIEVSSRANGLTAQTAPNGTNGQQQKQPSRLEQIYAQRREDVKVQKLIPSTRPEDLQASYDLGLAPPQISFPDRLRRSEYPTSLMAEIKRASPSKGDIQLSACAPAQARKYAEAGASVISVLTEPHWFKGSLDDLRAVRQSLEGMPNRPAILRKEFVFEEYQILEARLAGADTILLIVKMLDIQLLTRLYQYSQSLGMEPLVEVNTAEEMKIAVELGSQVIGVNNRDLTTFDVDMGTTGRLMEAVPKSTIVCALSGIQTPTDVQSFSEVGAKAVLVGEALMRAKNTVAFISDLLGKPASLTEVSPASVAVKICGTRTAEAAKIAVQNGADFIGVIRVPGRSRYVSDEETLKISRVIRETPKPSTISSITPSTTAQDYFKFSGQALVREDRAQLVGVFLDASLESINDEVRKFGFNVIQLHGSEPLEWARNISVPVIRRFAPNEIGLNTRAYHAIPLLDAGAGGSGQKVDVSAVRAMFELDPSIRTFLAGGLNPDNVGEVLESLGSAKSNIVGVDVSSGVESNGKQDIDKIVAFIKAAKAISR